MENKSISEIAHALAAVATAGKWYTKDKFDLEHYEDILNLSRELLTIGTDITPEQAADLLEGNDGYQTPKAEPYRLAAVLDHRKNNNPKSMFCAVKCFVLCRDLGGEFVPNIETTEARYFPLDQLPEINTHKCSLKEIELCLKAFRADTWETVFD